MTNNSSEFRQGGASVLRPPELVQISVHSVISGQGFSTQNATETVCRPGSTQTYSESSQCSPNPLAGLGRAPERLKSVDICYSAAYMSYALESPKWHLTDMIYQHIMWPSIAPTIGQLDPQCN